MNSGEAIALLSKGKLLGLQPPLEWRAWCESWKTFISGKMSPVPAGLLVAFLSSPVAGMASENVNNTKAWHSQKSKAVLHQLSFPFFVGPAALGCAGGCGPPVPCGSGQHLQLQFAHSLALEGSRSSKAKTAAAGLGTTGTGSTAGLG